MTVWPSIPGEATSDALPVATDVLEAAPLPAIWDNSSVHR